jgi:hypothetical protein
MPQSSRPLASPSDASLVQCFGHSLTNGYGLGDTAQRASSKLAGLMGSAQEFNQSINGATLGWADADLSTSLGGWGGVSWIAQRLKRYRGKAPYTGASDIVLLQYGLNDMIGVGISGGLGQAVPNNTNGLATFGHALRTSISLFRSSALFLAQNITTGLDSTITLGGTWANQTNSTTIAKGRRGANAISPGTGYVSCTAANTITIKVPGDYPGGTTAPILLGFVGHPQLTAATVTVTGAGSGTINLAGSGVADTTNVVRNLCVLRIANVAASTGTAQTLTLTISGLTAGSGHVGFWGWGIESPIPPVVAVCDVSRSNPVGGFWSKIADSDITTWNATIASVVAEFGSSDTFVVPTDTMTGGIGSSGWRATTGAGVTTVSPANGGTLAVTADGGSPSITNTAGVAMLSPGGGYTVSTRVWGAEIITYTGFSGGALQGVQRGAYGTVAAQHNGGASGATIRQINAAAIPNFAPDGIHWSEQIQGKVAEYVAKKATARIANVTRSAQRVGPGRPDVRASLVCSRSQIILRSGGSAQALIWDEQLIDTAMGHSPGQTDSTLGDYNARYVIQSDGLYMVRVSLNWDQGKAVSTGATASMSGILFTGIRKNGGIIAGLSTPLVTNATAGSGFSLGLFVGVGQTVHAIDEFRVGDYIDVGSWQGGAGTMGGITNAAGDGIGVTGVALTGALTTATTTIPVTASTTGIATNDIIRVDDEHMQVTGGGGTASLTVTRAADSTTAAAHLSGAAVYNGRKILAGTNPYGPRLDIVRLQAI